MTKKIICVILLAVISLSTRAQEQDFGLRSEIGLRYRFNKKSNIEFSYRLDLKENLGQFRRSNFSFAYNRNINKWLSAEIYYRFITNYNQDEQRFRASLSVDKKIARKTKIKFRTLVQHDIDYFDTEYLQRYKPEWVWRNKLSIERKFNKRWEATIYTEPFISQSYKGFNPYRLRSGAVISYEKKRWKLSAEYFYQNEFYFETSALHIVGVGARYDITRIIRPKKKSKKKKSNSPKK